MREPSLESIAHCGVNSSLMMRRSVVASDWLRLIRSVSLAAPVSSRLPVQDNLNPPGTSNKLRVFDPFGNPPLELTPFGSFLGGAYVG